MKKLISLFIILCFWSCRASKFPCGDPGKHDSKRFRVYKIDHRQGGRAVVYMRRYRETKAILYECLPDSITVGSCINLPNI